VAKGFPQLSYMIL